MFNHYIVASAYGRVFLTLVFVAALMVHLPPLIEQASFAQDSNEKAVERSAARSGGPDRSSVFNKIFLLEKSHSFNQAIKFLDSLLKKYPQDPEVHLLAGRLFRKTGAINRSIQEYEKTHYLKPKMSEPLIALSELHLMNLNTKAAIDYAHQAIEVRPGSIRTNLALISALAAGGYLAYANKLLESLLSVHPNNSQIQYMAYKLHKERGQLSLAKRYLEDAIAFDPQEVQWLIDLSELCQAEGEYAKSRRALEQVLERNPNSIEALNKLATLLEFVYRDYDGAIVRYQRILTMDPESVAALTGLDRCRVKNNDFAAYLKYQLKSNLSKLARDFHLE